MNFLFMFIGICEAYALRILGEWSVAQRAQASVFDANWVAGGMKI